MNHHLAGSSVLGVGAGVGAGRRSSRFLLRENIIPALLQVSVVIMDQAAEHGLHLKFALFALRIQYAGVDALSAEGAANVVGSGHFLAIDTNDPVLSRIPQNILSLPVTA
jgi:hypothetical protein